MPSIVIGYNVEYRKDRDISARFLAAAAKLHRSHNAPCTFYLLPELAKELAKELRMLQGDPLFDFQMTLSSPLKTVCQMTQGQITVWRGASLEDIDGALSSGMHILNELFGIRPTGISDALGAYRGLMDRPDVLEVLQRHGILFTRTWARDRFDWQPVDFAAEPHWYGPQGFPNMLEFPAQGWQESLIRPIYGWDEVEGYQEYLKSEVEETARREGQVWSFWSRDWSSMRDDKELTAIGALITQAQELGVELTTHEQAYRERTVSYTHLTLPTN